MTNREFYELLLDEDGEDYNEFSVGAFNEEPAWRTRDGRHIPISKMSDIHLINSIKYLERIAIKIAIRNNTQYNNIYKLTSDIFRTTILSSPNDSLYESIVKEAVKRGLAEFVSAMTSRGDIEVHRRWKNRIMKNSEDPQIEDVKPGVRKIIL